MKCAVAIVLALIGAVVGNPVGGFGYGAPLLVPSPVSVSASLINHQHAAPIIAPIIKPLTVPILKSVPIIRTPVVSAPLSIGYPGLGYGYGLGGYGSGYGGLGYGYGLGYGGLGWGKAGLGWGGIGIGKGWH